MTQQQKSLLLEYLNEQRAYGGPCEVEILYSERRAARSLESKGLIVTRDDNAKLTPGGVSTANYLEVLEQRKAQVSPWRPSYRPGHALTDSDLLSLMREVQARGGNEHATALEFGRAVLELERDRCARTCEISQDEIRLLAGEMTAQEMRSVRSVLKSRAAAIRSPRAVSETAS